MYGEKLFCPGSSGIKSDVEILPDDGRVSLNGLCRVPGVMNEDFVIDVDAVIDVCPSLDRKKSVVLKSEGDVTPGLKRKLVEEFDGSIKYSKKKHKLVPVKIEPKD